jgi:hypothetical protein
MHFLEHRKLPLSPFLFLLFIANIYPHPTPLPRGTSLRAPLFFIPQLKISNPVIRLPPSLFLILILIQPHHITLLLLLLLLLITHFIKYP